MENSNQDKVIIRLWDDFRSLVKERGNTDPGTAERQKLDQKYNKVVPLVALVTNPQYKAEVPDLAGLAVKILEDKKE